MVPVIYQKHYQKVHSGFQIYPIENPQLYTFLPTHDIKNLISKQHLLLGHHHLISKPLQSDPPPLRTINSPISGQSSSTSYTIDQLRKGFGFRNVNSFVNELHSTATNFTISTLDREPVLDIGETANSDKHKRNTTPLSLPTKPGDVAHVDIIYGSGTATGGYMHFL